MADWMADARTLLCRLIETPSINPMQETVFDAPLGEERMAQLLAALFAEWGCEVAVQEIHPKRPNVIAQLPARAPAGAPLLLIDAHTDTVAVGNRTDLLTARVEGTRVYGRGAVDVKGPLVSALLALRALAAQGGPAHCRVAIAATMGEEYNLEGARHVATAQFRPDAALVLEPTQLEIVCAHKGVVRWVITSHGRAGHGAEPHKGHNAIQAMARLLVRLEQDYPRTYAARRHALLGAPSFNVGRIEGGLQYNIIPDRCTITLERRTLPGEPYRLVQHELDALLHAAQLATPGDRFSACHMVTLEPLETDPSHPLATALRQALVNAGRKPCVRGAQWTANSGVYAAAGVPALVFGPGDTARAHTTDEWIDLTEVVMGAQIMLDVIERYGR